MKKEVMATALIMFGFGVVAHWAMARSGPPGKWLIPRTARTLVPAVRSLATIYQVSKSFRLVIPIAFQSEPVCMLMGRMPNMYSCRMT